MLYRIIVCNQYQYVKKKDDTEELPALGSIPHAKFWVARSLRDNYRTGKFLTSFAVWHSRKNWSATIQSKCHLETTIRGYMCTFVYRENDKIECNHLCHKSCSCYRFQYLHVMLITHTKWCLESLENKSSFLGNLNAINKKPWKSTCKIIQLVTTNIYQGTRYNINTSVFPLRNITAFRGNIFFQA
jgi:hypothetical protein